MITFSKLGAQVSDVSVYIGCCTKTLNKATSLLGQNNATCQYITQSPYSGSMGSVSNSPTSHLSSSHYASCIATPGTCTTPSPIQQQCQAHMLGAGGGVRMNQPLSSSGPGGVEGKVHTWHMAQLVQLIW